jgi:dTDP-4-amino-4,6-dideoxygalactose transaminase
MSKIPYLDLHKQYLQIRPEVLDALEQVCESTRFAQGPPVAKFEQEFADYCEVQHCVAVNSGTSALHLALRCLNIGPGDEVITVPETFIATVWAISYVGATPVFVDIDPLRRTLDPAKLESAITSRTKAILPVHLFGMPAEMDDIVVIADGHGIPVIEDAAQAHGARYKRKRVGQLGRIACFSFYPGKNLGAYGEGGALVTNDGAIAARAASLRDHAQLKRYYHEEIGYNYRMDSFQAAILSIKLKYLDGWNAARAGRARQYQQALQDTPFEVPKSFGNSDCIWHCFVVETDDRDQMRQRLSESGIETGLHYPVPIHLQHAYAALGYVEGDFPVSERFSQRCLSLPMYPELTDEQVRIVADAVHTASRSQPVTRS